MIIFVVCHRCGKLFKSKEEDEYACKYCEKCEIIMENE